MNGNEHRGFNLVELLTIISVTAVFIYLFLPAVSKAREGARRAQCVNNLKQMGLALHDYEATNQAFPMSLSVQGRDVGLTWSNGYSGFVRIMPYMEMYGFSNQWNFDLNIKASENTTATSVVVDTVTCPSERRVPEDGLKGEWPASAGTYGLIEGDWLVWGGWANSNQNSSAFGPNRSRKLGEFTDGLALTMMVSESRSRASYYSDCAKWTLINPDDIPSPDADPRVVVPQYVTGCTLHLGGARTAWYEGGVHQSGITTAWTPNKKIVGGSDKKHKNVDIIGRREELGGPTYAAVTARSDHKGGVNVLLGDGSVKFIKDSINGRVWRSLGTVAGGEWIPNGY